MKAIAINGSPRKGWNTERLLQEALRGAADAGAETELIHLYDLKYTGCRSCFACKRRDRETNLCCFRDELQPVLGRILQADVLLIGSPIYFGDVTGQTVSFLERLAFPLLSYDDYSKPMFGGHVNACFFFTMNAPQAYYESSMKQQLVGRAALLKRLGGMVETYACCDTLQFDDYARYHAGTFSEEHKQYVRAEQFPRDLEAAYKIGARLAR